MVCYSKMISNNRHYYKVQRARINIEYYTDTEIHSEVLPEFERKVIANGGVQNQKVKYQSKTYASNVNGRMRLTTCDKAYLRQPFYKYHITTYEVVSFDEYDKLIKLRKIADVTSNHPVVFFDIETGGLRYEDDILQISMKSGSYELNCYVDPTKEVTPSATKQNGLTTRRKDLFFNGVRVASSPLEFVLLKVLHFLQNLNNKCILVAHNLNFDMPRLLRAIDTYGLLDEYKNVIEGFCDTLALFRENFPNRPNNKLETLARDFGIATDNLHNSKYDVRVLEQLTKTALGLAKIGQNYKPIDDCLANYHSNPKAKAAPMSVVL